jgi:hypothetical protein
MTGHVLEAREVTRSAFVSSGEPGFVTISISLIYFIAPSDAVYLTSIYYHDRLWALHPKHSQTYIIHYPHEAITS